MTRSSTATSASDPQTRIVVAGVGLVSPLGLAAWETFRALLDGRTLADRADNLPDEIAMVDRIRALGCVSAVQHAAVDPAIELAERAAREALNQAGINPDSDDITCFIGTSKGAVHALTQAARQVLPAFRTSLPLGGGQEGGLPPSVISSPRDLPRAIALGAHGYLSDNLRDRLNLHDLTHYVAACAAGLVALHHARQSLIHQLDAGRFALVISSDAALTPMFIHSYHRLGVLAPMNDYVARPLDKRRAGFMLAEQGAAVVLERLPAGQVPQPGQIELIDSAIAGECHDLIRPSPTMPALAHIAQRLLARREIDLIHPHAPGTQDHDAVEFSVYRRLLGESCDVYAVKGALGHSLGASGLASFVIAYLCARANRRPPMHWLNEPIDPMISPVAAANVQSLRRHAVFAAGFAGHVAGAVIHRM